MSDRRIHTMWKMIAINDGGGVIAVFPKAFSDLVELLLPELDTFEKISFKMAASVISAAGSREHKVKIPEWESLFISRLKVRMSEVGHLLTFSVTGAEVEKYLADILEGYRGNHIGSFAFAFAFAIDELHGAERPVVTLNVYDSPTLWKKLSKSERDPLQRFIIPIADIQSLIGTSLQLEIKTRSSSLRLTRNGAIAPSQ